MFLRKPKPTDIPTSTEPPLPVDESPVAATLAPEPPPIARAPMTESEFQAWRGSIRHAGHGGFVHADARDALAAELSRRGDIDTLTMLARNRPVDVRTPGQAGAERTQPVTVATYAELLRTDPAAADRHRAEQEAAEAARIARNRELYEQSHRTGFGMVPYR